MYVCNHFRAVIFSPDVVYFWPLRCSIEHLVFVDRFINALHAQSIALVQLRSFETADCLIQDFLIAEDTLGRFLEINDLFHKCVFVESLSSTVGSASASSSSCLLLTCCSSMPLFVARCITYNTLSSLHSCLMWGCPKHISIYLILFNF